MHTIAQVTVAKADSNQPLIFSSGLTLYSPVNTTYSSNVLECNGTFDSPKRVQSSLNYSLDGKYMEGLPWKFNPDSIANINTYTIDGSFQLPQLSDGTHQLSIGILEEQLDNSNINSPRVINSTSWVNTVYFSISTTQPSNPTPTPDSFCSRVFLVSNFALVTSHVICSGSVKTQRKRYDVDG